VIYASWETDMGWRARRRHREDKSEQQLETAREQLMEVGKVVGRLDQVVTQLEQAISRLGAIPQRRKDGDDA
jgi:hypothetical protein